MFLALGLAAQGSVEASPSLWLASLIALMCASYLLSPALPTLRFTPLVGAVVFFAAWLAMTNKWANPSYTAAAPYHAGFLLGGFFLGRRSGAENASRLFNVAVTFAVCLAVWAIWQRIQGEVRAHALFETPATLMSTINLVLLPGLVVFLSSKRHALLTAALLVLTMATIAGMSRGGWLGLAIGGFIAYEFGRRAKIEVQPGAVRKLIAVVGAALVLSWLIPALGAWLTSAMESNAVSGPQLYSMAADVAAESSIARLGLYELAWNSIAPASLLSGFGYLGYYYLLEAGRSGIASYEQSVSYFVHNDYLQILLELGLPGLASLIGMTAWPLIAAWRAAPQIAAPADRLVLVALVAALGSMSAHAMVDFPFYIPVCLLIYGAALGVMDSLMVRKTNQPRVADRLSLSISLRKAVVAGVATVGAWMLAMPVAAEAAAGYAHRQWRAAHGEKAAYWFEVARRIEPRDWRYHWYAGQFWFAQASLNSKPAAAQLADEAFSQGYEANPREFRNLLGRIDVHRQLRNLLEKPADVATLWQWTDKAVELAPSDPRTLTQRALVLKQFGPRAKEIAK